MVRLPSAFVKVNEYPGYYWNVDRQELWTMKVNGVLRPLTMQTKSYNPRDGFFALDHYRISHKGKPRTVSKRWLQEKYGIQSRLTEYVPCEHNWRVEGPTI